MYDLKPSTLQGYFTLNEIDYPQFNYSLNYPINKYGDIAIGYVSVFNIHSSKFIINSIHYSRFVGISTLDDLLELFYDLKVFDTDATETTGGTLPIATRVIINGSFNVGDTVTGGYEYSSPNNTPEQGTTYKWYISDFVNGTGKIEIQNETTQSYLIKSSDVDKFISFDVTPSDGAFIGASVSSVFYSIIDSAIPLNGSGTEIDPYQIDSIDHLIYLSETPSIYTKFFIQTADINGDSIVDPYNPIGSSLAPFAGSYNGDGHTIENISIARNDSDVGLFGVVTECSILNLKINSFTVLGNEHVGGLIGRVEHSNTKFTNINTCSIDNSKIGGIGLVSGAIAHIGGLIGSISKGVVNSCYSGNLDVSGDVSVIGGLIGGAKQDVTISNCYSYAKVGGQSSIGGLIGSFQVSNITLINSQSYGLVIGTTIADIGGLVGNGVNGVITACYYDGETSNQPDNGFGIRLTTLESLTLNTYPSSWNINGTETNTQPWVMTEGSSRPYLYNQIGITTSAVPTSSFYETYVMTLLPIESRGFRYGLIDDNPNGWTIVSSSENNIGLDLQPTPSVTQGTNYFQSFVVISGVIYYGNIVAY